MITREFSDGSKGAYWFLSDKKRQNKEVTFAFKFILQVIDKTEWHETR